MNCTNFCKFDFDWKHRKDDLFGVYEVFWGLPRVDQRLCLGPDIATYYIFDDFQAILHEDL